MLIKSRVGRKPRRILFDVPLEGILMSYAEDKVGSACENSGGRGVALVSEISGMEMVIHRATAKALARALVVRNTGALGFYNTPMWLRLGDLTHGMALVVVADCEYGLGYHTSSWSLY